VQEVLRGVWMGYEPPQEDTGSEEGGEGTSEEADGGELGDDEEEEDKVAQVAAVCGFVILYFELTEFLFY